MISYDKDLKIPYITCKDRIKKAGCFIYDSNHKKVLLVQSRGQLWGAPKGSVQDDESPLECALREVKEETGLEVDPNDFIDSIVIKSKAMYYFIDTDSTDINLFPQHFYGNDANGIGWVQVDCLIDLIQNGRLQINRHCKSLIEHVFNVEIKMYFHAKPSLLHTLIQSKTT